MWFEVVCRWLVFSISPFFSAKFGNIHLQYQTDRSYGSSLDSELLVGEEESFGVVLVDLDHADYTTGAAITIGSKRNYILEEVFGLLKSKVRPVILVEVTPDEG